MAKHLLHIIIIGSQIIGKSLVKSIKEEIKLSQEAATYFKQQHCQQTKHVQLGLSLREAQEILDVGREFTRHEIEGKFKFLFEANSDRKGGNLYLRSKLIRAKERLDFELKQHKTNNKTNIKGFNT